MSNTLQDEVDSWLLDTFGPDITYSLEERNHRFLEEALELVQACYYSRDQAHAVVDYVFNRDIGDAPQEVGGTVICLAALCTAIGVDMFEVTETEADRIWEKQDKIREKHANKPAYLRDAKCSIRNS